mmetsp:Transcript_17049/g.54729  ORF Transcript_17049/g.54729 Transcript_17049/m.54729 type:complete len:227 (-) Transcript_17049:616-1296(-)
MSGRRTLLSMSPKRAGQLERTAGPLAENQAVLVLAAIAARWSLPSGATVRPAPNCLNHSASTRLPAGSTSISRRGSTRASVASESGFSVHSSTSRWRATCTDVSRGCACSETSFTCRQEPAGVAEERRVPAAAPVPEGSTVGSNRLTCACSTPTASAMTHSSAPCSRAWFCTERTPSGGSSSSRARSTRPAHRRSWLSGPRAISNRPGISEGRRSVSNLVTSHGVV